MNEVSELRCRHIVKACLSSKRIRAPSRQARDFRAAHIWTWELNSTIGLCLTAIGVWCDCDATQLERHFSRLGFGLGNISSKFFYISACDVSHTTGAAVVQQPGKAARAAVLQHIPSENCHTPYQISFPLYHKPFHSKPGVSPSFFPSKYFLNIFFKPLWQLLCFLSATFLSNKVCLLHQ